MDARSGSAKPVCSSIIHLTNRHSRNRTVNRINYWKNSVTEAYTELTLREIFIYFDEASNENELLALNECLTNAY